MDGKITTWWCRANGYANTILACQKYPYKETAVYGCCLPLTTEPLSLAVKVMSLLKVTLLLLAFSVSECLRFKVFLTGDCSSYVFHHLWYTPPPPALSILSDVLGCSSLVPHPLMVESKGHWFCISNLTPFPQNKTLDSFICWLPCQFSPTTWRWEEMRSRYVFPSCPSVGPSRCDGIYLLWRPIVKQLHPAQNSLFPPLHSFALHSSSPFPPLSRHGWGLLTLVFWWALWGSALSPVASPHPAISFFKTITLLNLPQITCHLFSWVSGWLTILPPT